MIGWEASSRAAQCKVQISACTASSKECNKTNCIPIAAAHQHVCMSADHMSADRSVRGPKCPQTKMSADQNVRRPKCPQTGQCMHGVLASDHRDGRETFCMSTGSFGCLHAPVPRGRRQPPPLIFSTGGGGTSWHLSCRTTASHSPNVRSDLPSQSISVLFLQPPSPPQPFLPLQLRAAQMK